MATIPVLVGPSGAQKPNPVRRRHAASRGKVVNKRLRLPNVSTKIKRESERINNIQRVGRTGIEGRSSEDPVYQSGAHGYEQGRGTAEPSLQENSCRIIGYDVDTAELLHKHHKTGGLSGSPVPRHPEELQKEVATTLYVRFGFEESIRVEHVTGSLKGRWPKAQHCHMSINVTALAYVLERR